MSLTKHGFYYCDPIPYQGAPPCTVEFADTRGGLFTEWRITYEDGRVKVGTCEAGGSNVYCWEDDADLDDPNFDPAPASLYDAKAVKEAWPKWEALHERELLTWTAAQLQELFSSGFQSEVEPGRFDPANELNEFPHPQPTGEQILALTPLTLPYHVWVYVIHEHVVRLLSTQSLQDLSLQSIGLAPSRPGAFGPAAILGLFGRGLASSNCRSLSGPLHALG